PRETTSRSDQQRIRLLNKVETPSRVGDVALRRRSTDPLGAPVVRLVGASSGRCLCARYGSNGSGASRILRTAGSSNANSGVREWDREVPGRRSVVEQLSQVSLELCDLVPEEVRCG